MIMLEYNLLSEILGFIFHTLKLLFNLPWKKKKEAGIFLKV